MSSRIQWAKIAAVLAVSFALVPALSVCGDTTVLPMIGRVGSCTYCDCVENAISSAQDSIDLLLSDAQLDQNPLWDDVIAASDRGVKVRVLLDESDWSTSITEKNRPALGLLVSHGINARFDDPAVTTHSKLVVIDRRSVVLGSSNWNQHAFYDQAQTDVFVRNGDVGEAFAVYFDRLWDGTLFPGAVELSSSVAVETPSIIAFPETVDTANYASALLSFIRQAQKSIHVVMYRISYYPRYGDSVTNDILNALIAAAARGLDVRVFMDDCAFYQDSAAANLEAARYLNDHGVDVRMDSPSETTHAKLVIIDGKTAVLGSTNWNYYSLEKNNEVDIALVDLAGVAAVYDGFFNSLWNDGRRLGD